ncbi:MAG: ferrous iron transporter B [Oscillospiraceae bacterium]|jgi:ferrous iron transport protein B|nr:ferrous iron transporter B [Oscillospiraceae bacterium]
MTASARTDTVIALVGNPNVGKSTVFNALTNLRQHTGNWPGKTVETARGAYTYHGRSYTLVDLPGAYSLHPGSAEEEVTRDYLLSGEADVTLVVADATCLERNLALALQILEVAWPVVLCVNLLDEAEKKHIAVDLPVLERELGCPVIGTSARGGQGLDKVRQALEDAVLHPAPRPESTPMAWVCGDCRECRTLAAMSRASAIVEAAVRQDAEASVRRDRALDRLLTGKAGIPVMLLLLAGVLWLTMVGANVPSELLSGLLMGWQEPLRGVFQALHAPWWLEGALVDGVYRTVAWVVSVMLPPMAIFFPLFTLLEDAGYLPRVAFNLDHFFHRAGAHGRQSLTMCMGLGCNACGVMGCRIIQSPRERLIAILTNAFIPCNGRLPTLTALIAMFFVTGSGLWDSIASAALLMGCIVLAVAMTLWASRFLAGTFLKGEPSSFSLELPPYRAPQVGQVLVRSILDRTLFVLARAVVVAAPAGLLIWIAANVTVGGESILLRLAGFLQPLGGIMGLDGFILLAFLLGFPANEIVVPCILMGYLSAGSLTDYGGLAELHGLLAAHGWTAATALCALVLTLFHFPCGTTCFTIWKETRSVKWTSLAILLPTAVGAALCMLIHLACTLIQ